MRTFCGQGGFRCGRPYFWREKH